MGYNRQSGGNRNNNMAGDNNNIELSKDQIAELKRIYGPIFTIKIDGNQAYFRNITRSEVIDLGGFDGELSPEIEDAIFRCALLYPDELEIDLLPAGTITTVSKKVMELSCLVGASGFKKQWDRAKSEHSVFHSIAATICAAFPSIIPGELDSLPINKLMDLLSIADEVLQIKMMVQAGQYGELDFQDTNEDSLELDESEKDRILRQQLEQTSYDAGIFGGEVDVGKKPPWAAV
jgi:hypothetical protein